MNPKSTVILVLVCALLGTYYFYYEVRRAEETRKIEEAAKLLYPGFGQDLHTIEVTNAKGTFTLEKQGNDIWRLHYGGRTVPADTETVQSVVSRIEGTEIKRVIAEPSGDQDLEEYGLAHPQITIKITGAGKTGTLYIGGDNPARSHYYAKTSVKGQVVLVDRFSFREFFEGAGFFRDKRILPVSVDAIDRFSIVHPDETVVFVQKEGSWTCETDAAMKVDTDSVEKWLSDLSFMKAESFAELGGNNTSVKDTIMTASVTAGEDEYRITFVSIAGSGEKDSVRPAAILSDGTEYAFVDEDLLKGIDKRKDAFRYRKLFGIDDIDQISGFSIKHEDSEVACVKQDGAWTVTKPAGVSEKDLSLYGFLWALKDTRYEGVAEIEPQKVYELTLAFTGREKVVYDIWLSDMLCYCSKRGDKTVYQAELTLYEKIRKLLDQAREIQFGSEPVKQ